MTTTKQQVEAIIAYLGDRGETISVADYDLPTIVATTILAATFVVVMNLIVDIAYAYIDPRVRVQ